LRFSNLKTLVNVLNNNEELGLINEVSLEKQSDGSNLFIRKIYPNDSVKTLTKNKLRTTEVDSLNSRYIYSYELEVPGKIITAKNQTLLSDSGYKLLKDSIIISENKGKQKVKWNVNYITLYKSGGQFFVNYKKAESIDLSTTNIFLLIGGGIIFILLMFLLFKRKNKI
jgi:hypothetical protein